MTTLAICLLSAAQAADSHLEKNSLYADLLKEGVPVTPEKGAPLPPPVMPDGLDAAAQQAVLKEVAGRAYRVVDLTRKSTVSPYVLQIGEVTPSAKDAPAKSVDVYFVAFGDMDKIATKEFLDQLAEADSSEDWKALSAEDLAARKITIPAGREGHEGYGHFSFEFLERVYIKATMHSEWSETDESLVVAARVDPRFREDPEYPSQWRPIREGKVTGEPKPYSASGYYVKMTRLKEPAGAIFCEAHVIYAEPHGWFEGANLLRSKLPPVVQSEVRSLRREMLKASQ